MPAEVTADAAEVTTDAAEVTTDAAEVTTDTALFKGGSEIKVESVEASETSEVDEKIQTEAAIEDTSTAEETSTHEGIDVDDVIPVADVDNVDVVPDTVVVALEQEGNVEAVTSAVETTTMAPEEKATSSNPLAGVMDRLAALKTKVMEGDSANDEAQIGNETTVSEATLTGTVDQEPKSVPLAIEMEPGSWRLLLAVP